MKKIIEDSTAEGLVALLGERVTLFCANYFYTGLLAAVGDEDVLLQKPSIVYETGAFTEPTWKDAQALPHEIYVMRHAIEAYGIVK